jgi:hypothetical protein
VIAAVVAFWPGVAHAQYWWDFIESLSGPGPFHGHGAFIRVSCAKPSTPNGRWNVDWMCLNDRDETIRQVVEIRGLWAHTLADRPRLLVVPTDTRKVDLLKLDFLAAVRLTPLLDVGAGGGLIRFTGSGMTPVKRATLIPFSATYTPFALKGSDNRWKRAFRIRMETTYIPFGFLGGDWGNPTVSPASYSTDGNWVLTGGVLIDLISAVR